MVLKEIIINFNSLKTEFEYLQQKQKCPLFAHIQNLTHSKGLAWIITISLKHIQQL